MSHYELFYEETESFKKRRKTFNAENDVDAKLQLMVFVMDYDSVSQYVNEIRDGYGDMKMSKREIVKESFDNIFEVEEFLIYFKNKDTGKYIFDNTESFGEGYKSEIMD